MSRVHSLFGSTNKLVRRNFLLKRTNPDDRRGVLLSIAPAGRVKLDQISEEIRWINDHFFGGLDAKAFDAMCLAATKLVQARAAFTPKRAGQGPKHTTSCRISARVPDPATSCACFEKDRRGDPETDSADRSRLALGRIYRTRACSASTYQPLAPSLCLQLHRISKHPNSFNFGFD